MGSIVLVEPMFNTMHLSDHNIAQSIQAMIQFAQEQKATINDEATGMAYKVFAVNQPSFEQFILCAVKHLGSWDMLEYVQKFMDLMEPRLSFACWPNTTTGTLQTV